MIKIEDIYRHTRGGLDVIIHYYPEAAAVVGTKNKFRCRPAERTPSAVLLERKSASGETVWKVCDFGADGHALSPLDVCMQEEGLTRPYEAVMRLAALFDVRDELNRSVNRPDIRRRAARSDERDGTRIFALLDEIPEAHLEVLGPRVSRETAAALHWYEAEYVGYVKDRQVTLKYSTPDYPIFMRECVVEPASAGREEVKFYKIYEPLNPDKGFRFAYTPEGVKPKDYINGLQELRAQYDALNSEARASATEGEPVREERLGEVVICSGERDALCCRAFGYAPVWFNSETYTVTERDLRLLTRYAAVVYNIPDLDATGRRRGAQLALRHLDVRTVWLPAWLQEHRDNRGRPCKDLRDWTQYRREIADFRGLLELAAPARFWTETVSQRTGRREYAIDSVCLREFLALNGFAILHDDLQPEPRYVRVEGHVVRPLRPRDVRRFLLQWCTDTCQPHAVRALVINSPKLADGAALESLPEVRLDFSTATERTQRYYFAGGTAVEVSADGMTVLRQRDLADAGRYVWADRVRPHTFEPLGPMFRVEPLEGGDPGDYDIEVLSTASPLFSYLINGSRMYWRRELEERFGDDLEAAAAYAAGPGRFRIDGESLTPGEIREQKAHLLAKIFCIGYLLHRHKERSRAWAPFVMDGKVGRTAGECNGRSGKSAMFQAVGQLVARVDLSGRDRGLLDNKHAFERVTPATDLVLVDDTDRFFPLDRFYDIITGPLVVNPKNLSSYAIPFEAAPKYAFTSNYVPTEFSDSTMGRMLYVVFSDYYHVQTDTNGYRESRSLRDDLGLGCDLFDPRQYPAEAWRADYNFLLQCLQFYLSTIPAGTKLHAPLDNIMERKRRADMGETFEDWAATYFAEEGDHLDVLLPRAAAFDDFMATLRGSRASYTMQRFSRQLEAFCELCPYIAELNPPALCNKQGRIVRRFGGEVKEGIYVRTVGGPAVVPENLRRPGDDDAAADDADDLRPGASGLQPAAGPAFVPDEDFQPADEPPRRTR